MKNTISLKGFQAKPLHDLGDDFRGKSASGDEIGFNNYYMEKNGKPYFGIAGEFHFSRMDPSRWEDELVKMRLGGINTVSTYVFWNHHEEVEGEFDFSGRRDIGHFVRLCKEQGLYVILRVGPFDHGEVRNGGLPDWLYGKPFEARTTAPGFLFYVKRLFSKIYEQTEGLYFRDGGPIIAVQVDNEYQHSSAGWEMTTGISNEWIFGGNEGETYMHAIRDIERECGLEGAFYTCTGWGGACAPADILPLWGGYPYRPWLFYSHKGEHPATEEYVYQDYHQNSVVTTDDFRPSYPPEDRPYACCEMGAGMMSSYYYRFEYPMKSVDALANIKVGSGCNFLGYYMFQGGTNPIGKTGTYMNEAQVPKISYDYQAALGEFGQERESYRRLKPLHLFASTWAETLCPMETVLPAGVSNIAPRDKESLRYAVRTDGKSGFLFVNNFQDHFDLSERKNDEVTIETDEGDITFSFDLAADENCILPFNMDLSGIRLVKATAQPVTVFREKDGSDTYIFMVPEGMKPSFTFEDGAMVSMTETNEVSPDRPVGAQKFSVKKENHMIHILLLSRSLADSMTVLDRGLVFTKEALLEKGGRLSLETTEAGTKVIFYPAANFADIRGARQANDSFLPPEFSEVVFRTEKKKFEVKTEQVADSRYVLTLPIQQMTGVKDVRLDILYSGDIGHLFVGNTMIADNFCNEGLWETGLREQMEDLKENDGKMVLYITPLKEGVNVNVESTMAGRLEEVGKSVADLKSVVLQAVYEIALN